MENKIQRIVLIVLGLAIGIVFSEYFEISLFEFSGKTLIILSVVVVGILVIWFFIKAGFKSDKYPHALGLPEGSVRAILALTLVVLFVLVSLYFYLDAMFKEELAEKILTILGTLVIAVTSFYFGIKATEQGGKLAQNVFKQAIPPPESDDNIPPAVIQDAISKNRDNWIKLYKCIDVKLGKKVAGETQFELNCILFLVGKKETPKIKSNEIPPSIPYNYKGKQYSIPTDVKVKEGIQKVDEEQKKFIELDIEKQKKILRSAKKELMESWATNFDNLQSVSIGQKVIKGEKKAYYSLIFQVNKKKPINEVQYGVPPQIEYEFEGTKYLLPTDIEEVGDTYAQSYKPNNEPVIQKSPYQPGCSVGRNGSSEQATGTFGLKVRKKNSKESDPDYILSCYHVLCSKELLRGLKMFVSQNNTKVDVLAPGPADGPGSAIAVVKEGLLDATVDAAIASVNKGIIVETPAFGMYNAPSGIRELEDEDEDRQLAIKFVGRTSNVQYGIVLDKWTFASAIYEGNIEYTLHGVIQTTKISEPGDSGGCVYDLFGNIIGMVFSGNRDSSYVVPIKRIFNKLNLEPCLI